MEMNLLIDHKSFVNEKNNRVFYYNLFLKVGEQNFQLMAKQEDKSTLKFVLDDLFAGALADEFQEWLPCKVYSEPTFLNNVKYFAHTLELNIDGEIFRLLPRRDDVRLFDKLIDIKFGEEQEVDF